MAFYTFSQNNSGGSFHYDEYTGITEFVIIEASSLEEATTKAEIIGIYFDGVDKGMDCECCGDRWYEPYRDKPDTEPTIYSKPAREYESLGWTKKPVAVHYANATIEMF